MLSDVFESGGGSGGRSGDWTLVLPTSSTKTRTISYICFVSCLRLSSPEYYDFLFVGGYCDGDGCDGMRAVVALIAVF